ncbi:MAG TPA: hypothetical protein VEU96_14295 [Bryobacteraceae bacterium]|nr:hypothetical protein [Bryobacteraceae bacterium]
MRTHLLFAALCSMAAAMASGQTVPVRITAGATVSITKHIPASSREIYTVEASAGQTLLADLENGEGEVQVLGPGATKPLPSIDVGGPSVWMNVLAKAGTYQIAVRTTSKKPYDLAITLMDPHDPRLDPGVTPDQVSLDLGAFGGKSKLKPQPFTPLLRGDQNDGWPAHLSVENEKIEFKIMSLEGLRKRMALDQEWAKGLGRLEAALKPGGKTIPPEQLPPGNSEAALLLSAREEMVENQSFRALRYVGFFAQDVVPPSNPLSYILQGVSSDGRYFIMMSAQCSHPSLAKPGARTPAALKEVARRLTAAAPDSFKPSLTQLDAVARSLRLP